MNFLGQSPSVGGGESEGVSNSHTNVATPYPGVALFFLPELAQESAHLDYTKLQVDINIMKNVLVAIL